MLANVSTGRKEMAGWLFQLAASPHLQIIMNPRLSSEPKDTAELHLARFALNAREVRPYGWR